MGAENENTPAAPFSPDLVLAVVQDLDARGEHLVVQAEAIRLLLSAASQTFAALTIQDGALHAHEEATKAVEYAVRRGALYAPPGADSPRLSKLALAQLEELLAEGAI